MPSGRWRLAVPLGDLTEVFELSMTGTVQGGPVRAIGQSTQAGAQVYDVLHTGHDADVAEGFGLTRLDAGVYVGAVRVEDLADVRTVQLVAQGWPGAQGRSGWRLAGLRLGPGWPQAVAHGLEGSASTPGAVADLVPVDNVHEPPGAPTVGATAETRPRSPPCHGRSRA